MNTEKKLQLRLTDFMLVRYFQPLGVCVCVCVCVSLFCLSVFVVSCWCVLGSCSFSEEVLDLSFDELMEMCICLCIILATAI